MSQVNETLGSETEKRPPKKCPRPRRLTKGLETDTLRPRLHPWSLVTFRIDVLISPYRPTTARSLALIDRCLFTVICNVNKPVVNNLDDSPKAAFTRAYMFDEHVCANMFVEHVCAYRAGRVHFITDSYIFYIIT
jgi:hypothetical protein